TKELLNNDIYKYLKNILRQISLEVIEQNKKTTTLFENTDVAIINPAFNSSYINYLTKYSNSILNFSELKKIDKLADSDLIKTLYKKYVDENIMESSMIKHNKFEDLKTSLYPKIQNQYNIETEFSANEIPNLAIPLKIDIIGKNERVVFAQSVDLERGLYHIQNDMGVIAMLNQVFDSNAVGYIISSEPNKNLYPKQYSTWLNIRNSNIANYIDVSEVDKLKEYADIHNVKPLVAIKND
ncbi:MAG: hypothetical protein WBM13_09635, partial [Bacteroidia bacterium]